MNPETPPPLAPLKLILQRLPAFLLITAAFAKAVNPTGFLYELSDYDLPLPLDLELGLVLLLPFIEVLLGMMILLRPSRLAVMAAIVLLLVFSLSIVLGLPGGYLQKCGCLGAENLDPVLALLKNGTALLFLVLSLKFSCRQPVRLNIWGSLALVAGAFCQESLLISVIVFVVTGWAIKEKGWKIFLVLLGFGVGLCFGYLHLPLLLLPLLAMAFSFIEADSLRKLRAPVLSVSFILLLITGWHLILPRQPQHSFRFQLEQPIPDQLISSADITENDEGWTLVALLAPECDLCRLWLPEVISLGRREGLPPLVGVAPGSRIKVKTFSQREQIPFPVFPVAASVFESFVEETPQLLLVKSGTLRYAFPDGRLPRASQIENILTEYEN
jgi:hypothetical protein